MKKRFLGALLVGVLCLSTTAMAANEPFPAAYTYPGFADVPAGSWFESAVRTCYEVGLMNGTDEGFSPNATLPVSQCAVVAARMRATLTGETIPMPAKGETSYPWYAPYLSYLEGVMAKDPEFSFARSILATPEYPASRQDFIYLLGVATNKATDRTLYPAINSITSLPDTNDSLVLNFYNVGILTGVDDYGTFNAGGTLTRAECAAMVARVARPELRQTFTPKAKAPSGGMYTAGGYANFIRSYLGDQADATYFTYGDLSVSAGDWLNAALNCVEGLNELCKEQGLDFNWGYTYSGADLLTYTYQQANTVALEAVWEQSGPTLDLSGFGAWSANRWKAKHILVSEQDTANMLYDFLQGDPNQFDALVTVYGEDPGMTRNPGGYVFGPGEMVAEFEDGVKALQPGQIGAPVQSQYGWHIIQRLALTQEDYTNAALENAWTAFLAQGGTLEFSGQFPDGIDIQAAWAAYHK